MVSRIGLIVTGLACGLWEAVDIFWIDVPAIAAITCWEAGELAPARMTVVYAIAPWSSSTLIVLATDDSFWPMAT